MNPSRRLMLPGPAPFVVPLVALLVAAPDLAGAQVAGVTEKEIVFANVSAFSGTSRELGLQMKTGVETAFLAVNEAGGVHGRMLKLFAQDHGNDPPRALQLVRELVEGKKVFGFVGNTGSAAVNGYLDYLLKQRVTFFGSLSGAPFLYRVPPDRYVFNFRASYAEEAAAAVRYLVQVRRIAPSAIAYFAQDDDYGEAGWAGLAWQLRRYGLEPSQIIRTGYKRNSADVTDAAKAILQSRHVKAVVCFGTHKLVSKLVEKLHRRALIYTNASAVEPQALADELRALGTDYTRDVFLTQVVLQPTSQATAVLRYREQLKRYFPQESPNFLSLQAWLASQVLIEGLRRAGRNLDTERLVDALEGIRDLDLGIGASFSFGPSDHQASHKVWALRLEPTGAWSPVAFE